MIGEKQNEPFRCEWIR